MINLPTMHVHTEEYAPDGSQVKYDSDCKEVRLKFGRTRVVMKPTDAVTVLEQLADVLGELGLVQVEITAPDAPAEVAQEPIKCP